MYTRQEETYQISEEAISRILDDTANPLRVISDLIDPNSFVLDVGAGNGVLAQLFKRLGKSVHIHGVEPDPSAARLASVHYDLFVQGTFDDAAKADPIIVSKYDYIVLADVIEHTPDPISTLRHIIPFLNDHGKLLLSVPNVAFAPIRAELMSGNWEYTDWGIIERTHLRFFSKIGLVNTLESAGLSVQYLHHLGRSPFEMEKRLHDYRVNPLSLLEMKSDPLAFTYQFLAVCTRLADDSKAKSRRDIWENIHTDNFLRSYYRLRRSNLPG